MPLSDADRFAELVDADLLHADDAEHGDHHAVGYHDGQSYSPQTGGLLALVDALRNLEFDVSPSDLTLGRHRQRLVAMAAVRTTEVPDQVEAGRHRARHSAEDAEGSGLWAALSARLRKAASGRRVIAGIGGLSVIVAALGILALLAQSASPGDTLYALKRGTEQARLVLAGGEQAQGHALLGFASTRLDELDKLLDERVALIASGSGVQAADSGSVAELLISTMDTMDQQTTDGTSALTTAAVSEGSLSTLQYVGEWGIDEFGVLDGLTERMPQQAKARAAESKNLLQRVVQRLELLAQGIGCERSASPATDDLGPLPPPSCTPFSDGSPSAAGPGTGSITTTTAPMTTAAPGGETSSSSSSASSSSSSEQADPTIPSPPGQLPIPVPIPIPTQSTSPTESSPSPMPPPPPNEGEPCVLIGFLGIQIPGIIIGGVCIGLGG